ncbi:MAG: pantetheine-phosphate adenylyltransferase [Sphaerochaeta sp.]|jgi:pantetheine-phosphate adenylyltransferase|nr:pantetheine-phosphate adenylyltransferase [Sphaerochaeta sp.]MCH3920645.1 pantetheine-phosphate adenylyltransferase [Sphaerochaeta sp.]MCI2045169.1 pantetheine-phosphate adenylyltransferase [Sphaerochaeta sp.]MCI2076163.1 pantetheine-phosphate adenylyltransferase [Sphaerochaeta sp.]MCI2096734.1 pantetheine-phosphate adenylyltransferase [Sphaerochaeta sp.]
MSDNHIAMLPGSFDPPTYGHIDIIERSAALYDKLYVVVADNIEKKYLFTAEERKAMLEEILAGYPNVQVETYRGLVVEFARSHQIGVMIRGVRALVDFGYEFELAMTNKQINPDLEVLFMPTSPKYFLLRSSGIKEMASFGADVSKLVPKVVAQQLKKRIKVIGNE